jgi:hypothetical protein
MVPRHRREIKIPTLQFVATGDLVLHEQHDASRTAPLAERLSNDGMLKNPPVVTPIAGDERLIVLDGANRSTALARLGLPHVVVQIVDYEDPDLVLDSWYHLIAEFPRDEFAAAIQNISGITFTQANVQDARAALARRHALAYIVGPDEEVLVASGEGDLHGRAALLNALVDVYRYRSRIYRVGTDQIEHLRPYYQDVTALVVFPRYVPAEIIELVRSGARLPAGITRHVIPRRALRLNIPLAKMAEDKPLAEKNDWLAQWLQKKLSGREIRLYEESTWLFDE